MKENASIIFWGVLALIAFVSSFFIPVLWVKLVEAIFGGLNMVIVLTWIIGLAQARKEYKRQMKEKEGA